MLIGYRNGEEMAFVRKSLGVVDDSSLDEITSLHNDSQGKAAMRKQLEKAEMQSLGRSSVEHESIRDSRILADTSLEAMRRADEQGIRGGTALRDVLEKSVVIGEFPRRKGAAIKEALRESSQNAGISVGLLEYLRNVTLGDTEINLASILDVMKKAVDERANYVNSANRRGGRMPELKGADVLLSRVVEDVGRQIPHLKDRESGIRADMFYEAALFEARKLDVSADAALAFISKDSRVELGSLAGEAKGKSKEAAVAFILIREALAQHTIEQKKISEVYK